jgi:predicted kinase
MKLIILTIGLPRSGKTTWARQQGFPIVCPDSIRLALHGQRFVPKAEPHVWAIVYTMIEALLLAGHDTVIVDATHTTKKRRAVYVEKFSELADVAAYDLKTDRGICLDRARWDGDKEIVPIIEHMWEQYEELSQLEERILDYDHAGDTADNYDSEGTVPKQKDDEH